MSLFSDHYYNRTIRKITSAFGAMFSDIQMIRYNKVGDTELERVLVPIVYGQKEKFITRLRQDPDLTRSIQVQLPRMSFEFMGLAYDSTRKQQTTLRYLNNDRSSSQYIGIPYNFSFDLTVYVRNIEDGAQIIEQILPIFNPEYTLTMSLVEGMDHPIDVPVLLQSTSYTVDSDGTDDTRLIQWKLSFVMKAYLYGPKTTAALIKKANTYFYDTTKQKTRIVVLQMATAGFSDYKTNEYVYQGDSFDEATSRAKVVEWDDITKKLYVTNDTLEPFATGTNIVGVDTGATYNLSSYYVSTSAIALSFIQPNPTTANANTSHSFTIQISEGFSL